MDFAGKNSKAEAFEDLFILHARVEIVDFENRLLAHGKIFCPQISQIGAD
jgi:hypothetical protein